MATIEVGAPAPDFTLTGDDGREITLSAQAGHKVVLYFYPKAGTEGCTLEAHDFNRLHEEFAAANTVVIGISADPDKAIARFRAKNGLAFPLAGDGEHKVLTAYDVWAEKSMYGRSFWGVVRTTLLIGTDGRIARIWPKVKVAGHAEEVLAAAKAL